jgi:exopolyphosphatase/pppGpp-phosphohydrolase
MTVEKRDTILLSLGGTQSRVQITGADGTSQTFSLALGLAALTPGPFRRDPPSALELEQAIMVVEDMLMPLAARIPPHPVLHLHSPVPLAEPLGSRVQSRENIERLFGQLVAMVEGDPLALAQLPKDRRFAAALLILREWMHHLDAGSVVLVDG